MTYVWLAAVFLPVAAIAAVLLYRRERTHEHRLGSLVIATVALALLTIVFDSVMIASDLFTYGDGHILGVRIALVPIEDFAYPTAAVILLPAVWAALGGNSDR